MRFGFLWNCPWRLGIAISAAAITRRIRIMEQQPKPHAPKGPVSVRPPDPLRSFSFKRSARGTCTATSKTSGKPCRYPAVPGAAVCRFHGGNAPQVRAKAMDRLIALQHPAVSALSELIDQKEFPTVRYAASRDVLDRTIGRPTERVEMDVTVSMQLLGRLDQGRLRNAELRKSLKKMG